MRAVRGRTFAAVALRGMVNAQSLGRAFGQESRSSTCCSRRRSQAGGHHAQDVGGRNGISLVREPGIARAKKPINRWNCSPQWTMVWMKPIMTAARIEARPQARLSTLSDQCVQRRLRVRPTAERSVTHEGGTDLLRRRFDY